MSSQLEGLGQPPLNDPPKLPQPPAPEGREESGRESVTHRLTLLCTVSVCS